MVRDTGLKLSPYIRRRKFIDSVSLIEVTSRINWTSDTTKFPSNTKIPTRVVGYLLAFRVTNPSEARAAVELVIASILSRCNRTTIPVLLIPSVHVLADHQVMDPPQNRRNISEQAPSPFPVQPFSASTLCFPHPWKTTP